MTIPKRTGYVVVGAGSAGCTLANRLSEDAGTRTLVLEAARGVLPLATTALRVEHGFHHTAVMHSTNIENMSAMARLCNCSIFVKNASNLAGLGYGIDVDGYGFEIAISGYSDKQLTLLTTVLDALTGLANRRRADQALAAELARAGRHSERGEESLGLMVRLAQGKMEDYGLKKPDHVIGHAHPTISGLPSIKSM